MELTDHSEWTSFFTLFSSDKNEKNDWRCFTAVTYRIFQGPGRDVIVKGFGKGLLAGRVCAWRQTTNQGNVCYQLWDFDIENKSPEDTHSHGQGEREVPTCYQGLPKLWVSRALSDLGSDNSEKARDICQMLESALFNRLQFSVSQNPSDVRFVRLGSWFVCCSHFCTSSGRLAFTIRVVFLGRRVGVFVRYGRLKIDEIPSETEHYKEQRLADASGSSPRSVLSVTSPSGVVGLASPSFKSPKESLPVSSVWHPSAAPPLLFPAGSVFRVIRRLPCGTGVASDVDASPYSVLSHSLFWPLSSSVPPTPLSRSSPESDDRYVTSREHYRGLAFIDALASIPVSQLLAENSGGDTWLSAGRSRALQAFVRRLVPQSLGPSSADQEAAGGNGKTIPMEDLTTASTAMKTRQGIAGGPSPPANAASAKQHNGTVTQNATADGNTTTKRTAATRPLGCVDLASVEHVVQSFDSFWDEPALSRRPSQADSEGIVIPPASLLPPPATSVPDTSRKHPFFRFPTFSTVSNGPPNTTKVFPPALKYTPTNPPIPNPGPQAPVDSQSTSPKAEATCARARPLVWKGEATPLARMRTRTRTRPIYLRSRGASLNTEDGSCGVSREWWEDGYGWRVPLAVSRAILEATKSDRVVRCQHLSPWEDSRRPFDDETVSLLLQAGFVPPTPPATAVVMAPCVRSSIVFNCLLSGVRQLVLPTEGSLPRSKFIPTGGDLAEELVAEHCSESVELAWRTYDEGVAQAAVRAALPGSDVTRPNLPMAGTPPRQTCQSSNEINFVAHISCSLAAHSLHDSGSFGMFGGIQAAACVMTSYLSTLARCRSTVPGAMLQQYDALAVTVCDTEALLTEAAFPLVAPTAFTASEKDLLSSAIPRLLGRAFGNAVNLSIEHIAHANPGPIRKAATKKRPFALINSPHRPTPVSVLGSGLDMVASAEEDSLEHQSKRLRNMLGPHRGSLEASSLKGSGTTSQPPPSPPPPPPPPPPSFMLMQRKGPVPERDALGSPRSPHTTKRSSAPSPDFFGSISVLRPPCIGVGFPRYRSAVLPAPALSRWGQSLLPLDPTSCHPSTASLHVKRPASASESLSENERSQAGPQYTPGMGGCEGLPGGWWNWLQPFGPMKDILYAVVAPTCASLRTPVARYFVDVSKNFSSLNLGSLSPLWPVQSKTTAGASNPIMSSAHSEIQWTTAEGTESMPAAFLDSPDGAAASYSASLCAVRDRLALHLHRLRPCEAVIVYVVDVFDARVQSDRSSPSASLHTATASAGIGLPPDTVSFHVVPLSHIVGTHSLFSSNSGLRQSVPRSVSYGAPAVGAVETSSRTHARSLACASYLCSKRREKKTTKTVQPWLTLHDPLFVIARPQPFSCGPIRGPARDNAADSLEAHSIHPDIPLGLACVPPSSLTGSSPFGGTACNPFSNHTPRPATEYTLHCCYTTSLDGRSLAFAWSDAAGAVVSSSVVPLFPHSKKEIDGCENLTEVFHGMWSCGLSLVDHAFASRFTEKLPSTQPVSHLSAPATSLSCTSPRSPGAPPLPPSYVSLGPPGLAPSYPTLRSSCSVRFVLVRFGGESVDRDTDVWRKVGAEFVRTGQVHSYTVLHARIDRHVNADWEAVSKSRTLNTTSRATPLSTVISDCTRAAPMSPSSPHGTASSPTSIPHESASFCELPSPNTTPGCMQPPPPPPPPPSLLEAMRKSPSRDSCSPATPIRHTPEDAADDAAPGRLCFPLRRSALSVGPSVCACRGYVVVAGAPIVPLAKVVSTPYAHGPPPIVPFSTSPPKTPGISSETKNRILASGWLAQSICSKCQGRSIGPSGQPNVLAVDLVWTSETDSVQATRVILETVLQQMYDMSWLHIETLSSVRRGLSSMPWPVAVSCRLARVALPLELDWRLPTHVAKH
eukprot:Rmarinus@m.26504